MALKKRRKYYYGDSSADVQEMLVRYSGKNGYPAVHFASPLCACGSRRFALLTDEDEGVGVRRCTSCGAEHVMGDGAQYLSEATPNSHECICGASEFELTAGVALYDGSEDVRWFYIGCFCMSCHLVGCFADWKNEFEGWQKLLSNV